jgi:hypothetical protein
MNMLAAKAGKCLQGTASAVPKGARKQAALAAGLRESGLPHEF